MGDYEDAEAEGAPPSFLVKPAQAGYYFWYAHVPHTPWEGVPFIGGKYPVGMFDTPTGDLEHAGGIHSVKIDDQLAELLGSEFPGLAIEWSVSAGSWFPPWKRLADVINEAGDLFP